MAARTAASLAPHSGIRGQQVHRLAADGQGDLDHVGVERIAESRVALQRLELQGQAFSQATRTHAGRLQALQQAQGDGEVVHQLFQLLFVVAACQAPRQLGQIVFQVTVVVERLDQETQRGGVFRAQAQRQRLTM